MKAAWQSQAVWLGRCNLQWGASLLSVCHHVLPASALQACDLRQLGTMARAWRWGALMPLIGLLGKKGTRECAAGTQDALVESALV